MDDFFQKVTNQQDPFKRLASFIPGFGGYIERQNRHQAPVGLGLRLQPRDAAQMLTRVKQLAHQDD